MTTIRIKPRKGVVLAGIPAAGADVEKALADEWLAADLVTPAAKRKPQAKASPKPAAAPAPKEG